MEVVCIPVGELQENCYLLTQGNDALLIDPGDEFLKMKKQYENYHVLGILITHHHFDHIGALHEVQNDTLAPVYEFPNLDSKTYDIGPFQFDVIKTPGHSKDSVTYYFKEENLMFVGDFIFKYSIGRMDLEGGSEEDMEKSIAHIKKYSGDITLYPGHGPKTTLSFEKQYNPYF